MAFHSLKSVRTIIMCLKIRIYNRTHEIYQMAIRTWTSPPVATKEFALDFSLPNSTNIQVLPEPSRIYLGILV